ncbi:hypothetical protein [Streptomyces sp. NPDC057257]|uniref:hypothetical protein n=1 Tax=Streptomyces sp. NPDC057257 TaxID=3346071 RepID=UPI00362B2CF6
MFLDQPIAWTDGHWPALTVAGVLLALLTGLAAYIVRRTNSNVLAAGIGALVCTGFSADTSWRFADHRLHMTTGERAWLFAAGEIVLVVCAVMARANKIATATDDVAGTPGVPGVMVWCIAGVQIIPAFAESGLVGGLVRAVFGPIMAALLWHLAMGLEIRITKPEALSTGLPAQIGHELRERLLSYLGLAVRGRTAEQVTRDRATARVVRLASRSHLGWWGRAALKAAVARSGAAVNGEQRHKLLQLLSARRNASELRTLPVISPWVAEPAPEAYPRTPLGVTGAELRRMDPVDAVLHIHSAHPDATPAELASLATEYGVPVSKTLVDIALRATRQRPTPPVPAGAEPPPTLLFADTAHPLEAPADPADDSVPDPDGDTYPGSGLQLYLTTAPEVHREVACAVPAAMAATRPTRAEVHARVPDAPQGLEHAFDFIRRRALEERAATRPAGPTPTSETPRSRPLPRPVPVGPPNPEAVPEPTGDTGTDSGDDWDALLARAREIDADHRRRNGRPASIHTLKTALRVGQPKAQKIRDALADATRKASR